MCGTDAMAAELSRRVRDDLIRWGAVSDGPAVALMNGHQASAGDWIMTRQNDNQVDAGEKGRKLANRDVLRIVNIDPRTVADYGYWWNGRLGMTRRLEPSSGRHGSR